MGEAPSAFPGRQKGFLGAGFEGSTLRDGEQGLYIREPPRQQDFQLSKYLQALHQVFFSLANRVKPLSANIGQASQNISVPPKKPQSPGRRGDSKLPGFLQQLQHLPHPTRLRESAARWGRGCRCVGTSGSRRMGGISPTGQVIHSHRTLAPREAAKSFTSIFHLSWRALLPQATGYLAAKAFSEKAGGHTFAKHKTITICTRQLQFALLSRQWNRLGADKHS